MKNIYRTLTGIMALAVVLGVIAARPFSPEDPGLRGAWHWQDGSREQVLSFADDYCMVAVYDRMNRKFEYSWGGPYRVEGDQLKVQLQFHTAHQEEVGKTLSYTLYYKRNTLVLPLWAAGQEWQRIDEGEGVLAGLWRFGGRKQGDQITETVLGDRRTLKMLTGSRFQWAAINIATKEFFGTGGGAYTFDQGKYTERIEFFSRDSSRVGAVLPFDGRLLDGVWHHSGLNSKGEPLYEIWKRLKP